MYKKVSTSLNFVEREKEIEKYWEENKIFEKSLELRKGDKTYTSMTDLLQLMVNRIQDTF